MTNTTIRFGCSAAALLTATAMSANAATVLTTNFNTPTYVDGALIASTDTTTTGQDGFINTSGGGTNNITVQGTATNGFVTLTTSGQDVRKAFDAATVVNSGSIYYTADITLSAAQSGGDYFIHLGDGTSSFYARTFAKSTTGGFLLGESPVNAAGTYGTGVLSFNTTYHILVRYDFNAGTFNDTATLFVNPTSTDGSTDTAYVSSSLASTGTDATQITTFNLRQGSAGSAATLSGVDNVTVFTGPLVPEPTSLALIGVAGVGCLRRRRA